MTPNPTSLQHLEWRQKSFPQLLPLELYKVMQLRNEVFVVEQNCIYQDSDNKDQHAVHIMAWRENMLAAYARLLPPGISYPEAAAIGRVVVAPDWRGRGLGKMLMEQCITITEQLFNDIPIRMSAQYHLQRFYSTFLFVAVGEQYLEDGIPHITMERAYRSA